MNRIKTIEQVNRIKTIEQVNSNLYGSPRFKVTFYNNDYIDELRKSFDIRKVKNENAYYITTYLTEKDLISKVNLEFVFIDMDKLGL